VQIDHLNHFLHGRIAPWLFGVAASANSVSASRCSPLQVL
jgi:hypothetical protein